MAIFDRFREERIPRTANKGAQAQSIEGLVSICSLGDYDSLLKEAQDGKEFSIGTEATFEMYGDSKEGFVPSRFIRYAPPAYASREDLVLEQMRDLKAILGKLCAIENDLAKKKK